MLRQGAIETQRHFVLPFAAEPEVLSGLRRVVSLQLVVWGRPGLADQAVLAVTELATNVIKHVGEGEPATLILAIEDGLLRIEVHDRGSQLPVLRLAGEGEEAGRGLALLSALDLRWGWFRTATGKAVSVELALDSREEVPESVQLRLRRATTVIEVYGRESGAPTHLLAHGTSVMEQVAADLIADLLHWLAARGCDSDDVLDRAQMHFEAELE
ncbi:ATP-binding protein [Streptomyces sp. 21So2-11]|uniref:ATP-binding protein n=1 Tax=Streptomyces sp. 21So2-11 TaxID=3144408 RepID=UPI00321B3260